METLRKADIEAVVWLNQWGGSHRVLDIFLEIIVSDYFFPILLALTLLGLWFWGKSAKSRESNQRAVITAVVAIGFANLVVLLINDYYFRPRPFSENELELIFYLPTDSSFPANPAVLSSSLAFGVWKTRKYLGAFLLLLGALWSLSRVYAGLFFFTDVFSGALLGIATAYLVSYGMRWLEPLPTLLIRCGRLFHLA